MKEKEKEGLINTLFAFAGLNAALNISTISGGMFPHAQLAYL